MDKNDKIYVAGHTGLIGSAVLRHLRGQGFNNLILKEHSELELTDAVAVDAFFDRLHPKFVVVAAGKVGGIAENLAYPADFLRINLSIQLNILQSAQRTNVERLIMFGSSCMYPRDCAQPINESSLWSGKPEPSSLPYAAAKLAGVELCLAYNRQFGSTRFIPVIPNSGYGPNDNFDPASAHVLSALIHRLHEAKQKGDQTLTLWGSGRPYREFVYADDIAAACHLLLTHNFADTKLPLPINIGTGVDYTIAELALKIANVTGFTGTIAWDTSKPDGAPRKLLDSATMRRIGWRPSYSLDEGLKLTYAWYLQHTANDREENSIHPQNDILPTAI